jgi:outer membrane protein assembly factor BamB
MAPNTHPLLPGIRCTEVQNPDWPQTLHDGQITGFSPLTCRMTDAPEIWSTLDVGGEVDWIETVTTADGIVRLLICDSRLRLVSTAGEVLWTSTETGTFCFFGDLCENGQDHILLGKGPQLILLNAETGQTGWSHLFEPAHVQVRVAVGNILSDQTGLEAVVFLAYDDEGCLFHFPPDGLPQMVWQRTVVLPDEWPERHDHGCDIKLDMSHPDEPVIWNIRHHRCRGFDARTGEIISTLTYRIDGQHLRNYGVWDVGYGKNQQPILCVASENVQKHVHGIRLSRDGENELLWSHYYGEVYVVPGVAVEHMAVADVDGDGITELVYNVLDPAYDYRAFVRVRCGETGRVKAEFEDAWCPGMGPDHTLLILDAPEGTTPVMGRLTVYRLQARKPPVALAVFENSGLWGVTCIGKDLLLRHVEPEGKAVLGRYTIGLDNLQSIGQTTDSALFESPVHTAIDAAEALFLYLGSQGTLNACTWYGARLWQLPLTGGVPPTISAADLNGDGQAELVVATAGHRVRIFSINGTGVATETLNTEFLGARDRHHSPLLYDLEGTGEYALIAPGCNEAGEVVVRAYRPDGELIWQTNLGVSTAQNGMPIAWIAGSFLPGPRSAVAISVNNDLRNIEGTCLLDGPTGGLLWFKGLHWQGTSVRPYLPNSFPTCFDFDGDGLDEIMMDMLSYMAVLRGSDGAFVYLNHTVNLGEEKALYAGNLYNSFVPLYHTPDALKPHWLVSVAGYGSFGLMNPDPREGVWHEDHGYDVPLKIGLIDVDGDGVMEAGYVLINHRTFVCRNLWTGEIKWTLELPEAPDSPVLAVDVDGDGKGEFLCGRYCLGTDENSRGEIRWVSPVSMAWAAIADFDGDGFGEIVCAEAGKIYILKGQTESTATVFKQ